MTPAIRANILTSVQYFLVSKQPIITIPTFSKIICPSALCSRTNAPLAKRSKKGYGEEKSLPQATWEAGDLMVSVLDSRGSALGSNLGRDIVLCPWTKHLTLTVPLSTQVYKWVPANLMLGVTLQWTSIPSRGE